MAGRKRPQQLEPHCHRVEAGQGLVGPAADGGIEHGDRGRNLDESDRGALVALDDVGGAEQQLPCAVR